MQFLENEFLTYLDDWEKSVSNRESFTDSEKKMLLSQETLLGLRVTSMNFKNACKNSNYYDFFSQIFC